MDTKYGWSLEVVDVKARGGVPDGREWRVHNAACKIIGHGRSRSELTAWMSGARSVDADDGCFWSGPNEVVWGRLEELLSATDES